MDLGELVRAAQHGDRKAWNRLVAWLEPKLRASFVRRYGPTDADDFVQETLIVAWTKLHTFEFRSGPQLRRWVFSIGSLKMMKIGFRGSRERRKRQRLAKIERSPSTSVDSRLERQRQLNSVHRSLDKLPPAQRRAVEALLDGKDADDVAKEAGISPSSARGTETKALQRLHRELGPERTPTP